MNETRTAVNTESAQYLTFTIGGEWFAMNILNTREVLKIEKITPIPETPEYMAGVINLRGNVVPVVDLRKKFHLGGSGDPLTESIIIAEFTMNDETIVIGALVDAVRAVLRFERNQIEPPPKIGMKLNRDLIEGLAKKDGSFIIILNVNKIFSEQDFSLVENREETPLNGSRADA